MLDQLCACAARVVVALHNRNARRTQLTRDGQTRVRRAFCRLRSTGPNPRGRASNPSDPNAGTAASGLAEVDLVRDDLKVLDVAGHQRHAVNIGGGGDRQVHRSSPWRSSALGDEGVQLPALARCGSVERQPVEVRLNSSEPAHSQRAGLIGIRRPDACGAWGA